MPTPTLEDLAQRFYPHLPTQEARASVIRLLDHLDNEVLRQARIERNELRHAPDPKEQR